MKLKPVNRTSARNCFIANQLATPGLGSLMGGRWAAGIGQLALAIVGFGMVLGWFLMTMIRYYGQITGDAPDKSYNWLGIIGGLLFVVSWFWALVTSISLLRQTSPDSTVGLSVPPAIKPPEEM